jgi:hypothetical protein
MAAPPPRLVPAKQPRLPDQRTPEQRYWRSFKVVSLVYGSNLGANNHQGIRLYITHPLLSPESTQPRHLLFSKSPNLQS